MINYIFILFETVLFLVFNIAMLINSYAFILLYRTELSSKAQQISFSLLIYFIKIYIIVLVLGVLNHIDIYLYYSFIVICESIWAYVIYYKHKFKFQKENFSITVTLLNINILDRISLTLLATYFAYFLAKSLFFPPLVGDSIGYHLPVVIEWINSNGFYALSSPFGYYPFNGAILSFWLIFPFRNDFLVNIQNVLPLLMLINLIYLINKECVINKLNYYIIILILSIHIIAIQMTTQENDILVFTFLLSFYLSFLYKKRFQNIFYTVLSGISLGILIGLKYNMLSFGAFVFYPFLIKNHSYSKLNKTRDALILLSLILFFGGFWYIRNWIVLGSPVFPFSLSLFGHDILKTDFGQQEVSFFNPFSTTIISQLFNPEFYYYLFLSALKCGIVWIILSYIFVYLLLTKKISWGSEFVLFFYVLLIYIFTPLLVENIEGSLNQVKLGYTPIRYGLALLYFMLISVSKYYSNYRDISNSVLLKSFVFFSMIVSIIINFPHLLLKYWIIYLLLVIMIFISLIKYPTIKISCEPNYVRITLFLFGMSIFMTSLLLVKDKIKPGYYKGVINREIITENNNTNIMPWFFDNVKDKNVIVYGLPPYPFYGTNFGNRVFYDNPRGNKLFKFKDLDFAIVSKDVFDSFSITKDKYPVQKLIFEKNSLFQIVYKDSIVIVYKNIYRD
ncbi:MAG: hypothetical protein NTY74_10815 [Ignavibacteriae bacterium]|nr:hypothetical protein [Ignavibacteriota bacterium]